MVRRIYVEKKTAYAAAANELYEDLKGYLKLEGLGRVRILIRYDIEDLADEVFDIAKKCVFSEPPVDVLYEDDFPKGEGTGYSRSSISRDSSISVPIPLYSACSSFPRMHRPS